MTPADKPRFEVVVGTSDAAERRLATVAVFRALTGLSEADVPDATVELLLDGVSADCVRYCSLARAVASVPTFGRESLRATWLSTAEDRGTRLVLPWRAPITEIEVTEGGVELVADVDFRLLGGGLVERMGSGAPARWSSDGIVVGYTAGWLLGTPDASAYDGETDPVPADLVARVVDQVKLVYDRRDIDQNLRSEDVAGVWSGAYNVAGGDAISKSGLMRALEDALAPYRMMGFA